MDTPLQLTFRHLDASDAVEQRVNELASKLERFYGGVTRCHVLFDAPSAHHHKGDRYSVRIELGVPGRDIIAHGSHDDIYVALRQAFDLAQRQLQQFSHTAENSRGEPA
ncbi:MAG: HPF/RaiA family ribosome-associated protein [Steroidobacteraceae bacterium]